jgi:hypothetical protein
MYRADHSEASSVSWVSEDASGVGIGNGDRLRTLTTGVMGFSIGGGTTALFSVPTSLNGIFSDSSISRADWASFWASKLSVADLLFFTCRFARDGDDAFTGVALRFGDLFC